MLFPSQKHLTGIKKVRVTSNQDSRIWQWLVCCSSNGVKL